ncbi:MAG: hypothetical protein OSB69_21115 [Alphaproteobacteria bacterium]|nr:hypothetical protein [Alphaproteobacteria bacterium]
MTKLPFGNKTVKLSLIGAQLLEALEIGVSQMDETKGRPSQVSDLVSPMVRQSRPDQGSSM